MNKDIRHHIQNCAVSGKADRAAFLIDTEEYFPAFVEAVQQAEESVLILGWDIDGRIQLGRESDSPRLYDLLNSIAENKPDLHIHVLIWDFPLAYSMDREPLQHINFPLKTHPRIHFRFDSEFPVGSSHHQKVVVIDDKVAFTGGIDLTARRWDSQDHLPEDPDRTAPGGQEYGPYHDVQMVVEGEIAAELGSMARKRWVWATGQVLDAPPVPSSSAWPESVEPSLQDETVGMALTLPEYKGRPECREVEAVYLQWVAEARDHIYMENQYFTSAVVRDALVERLQEEDGPEVVIVLSRMTSGLLEQLVMEPLQSDILDSLYAADEHDRLAVYCPCADQESEVPIKVHSKILAVDDERVTVGSANLNERSMGLDSECNLVLDHPDDTGVITTFRQHLLAHHFGMAPDEYAEAELESSMLRAVQSLCQHNGKLVREADTRNEDPLPVDAQYARPLDSSRPGEFDRAMDGFADDDNSKRSTSGFMRFGLLLAVFVLLALAWRFTPLSEYATPDRLLHWAESIRALPMAPVVAVLAYVVGSFVMFPVTLLIVLTASIFSSFSALGISLAGCLLAASATYLTGRMLGHKTVSRLSESKIKAVSEQLGKHGLISVVITRMVPVAPFSVINLVAGASHIRFKVFLLGTLLGMAPGLVGMTLFGGQLVNVLRDPGPWTLAVLGAIVVVVLVLGTVIGRRLKRMDDSDNSDESGTGTQE